jgi:signal transduction histidine kinase
MDGKAATVGAATVGAATWLRAVWSMAASGVVALGRGLVFIALAFAGFVPLGAVIVPAVFVFHFVHVFTHFGQAPHPLRAITVSLIFIICSVPAARLLAWLARQLASRWCGVSIGSPYRPVPREASPNQVQLLRQRAGWLFRDPATWRDLLWLAVNACGGFLLLAAPLGFVLYGAVSVVLPLYGPEQGAPRHLLHLFPPGGLALPAGLFAIALGLLAAPMLLQAYGVFARSLLGPTNQSELQSELAQRVRHLAKTRSDTLDASAVELRRIERDLHDGAQARLVAMGMTLEVAHKLFDTDPVAARTLLAEARDSSARALADLRDLVRGIHPPVLADRGLTAAISALVLDSPVRAYLDGDLSGRPSPPVESAAYFAVSELLANVAKHAGASRAWVDLRHDRGMLRIGVTDDGVGGADPVKGSGLRGIECRLAAFDGVLAVASPPGGPTVVNMEIPCELSSQKTSSC